MKTINGKYATAKVFTDNIEDKASEQILTLCNQSFTENCKIRIMPDVHAGSGCVIGFTADLGKKVIPNIVGVDIGCGMLVAELGIEHIDPKKLDEVIRERVPAGMNVHESQKMSDSFLNQLDCKDALHNVDWILRSMGTLGGGNHFIELDEDEDKNQYLVIHTGSRNLGKQVAEYHQNVAISNIKGKNKKKEATERLIAELKAQGREKEISQRVKELDVQFPDIPNELCYLEGKERDSYLNDMRICQAFAKMNRARIMHTILDGVGINSMLTHASFFETVHNYIDESDDIIRKGSVSARKGEKLIIPLNMRDGSLICIGKGNPDWNFSAPHGAGRLYSRTAAKKVFSVEEYKRQMDGIYTTSADETTLDECPMAYKPAQEIIDAISPTVEIVKHIKPMAYTNSPLVAYTKLSPNHSGQRTHSIDRITPHCVVGQLSAESICACFTSTSRQASCNYGIGKDGRVSLCVEEKNRSWCSSSAANDQRAITIECASDLNEPYTVAKASQGLADYLKKNFAEPSVAIGYDSRIKSDVFAKVAAGVFAANGVKVYIWPVLMPVPTVSFATRYLHTSAGVMVTASHNPSKYNGYKVYGADGCQITTEAAAEILAEIEKLDIFADVKTSNFEAGVANGSIQYIPDEVYTAFVEQVKSQSVLFGEKVNKDGAIVYSPLNGTGLKPVTRTLKEMGYTNITVVKEQEHPNGSFPTCPYPNPEIKEAMALGMEYAKKCNADLLLATDPDCDRVGIAVKNKAGEYELLTGNQTGMLLLDYICSQRVKHGKMPADPVMVKTIVTMDMGEQIAAHYGLRTINVLTGFKFIGEQIGKLEQQGKADSYVFGFEESYGYLTGSYVRDKDGVDGAYMICEMFSYYATQGISLLDKLDELYKTYGYCLNTLHSYEFDGSAGFAKMQSIMQAFCGDIKAFGGKKVVKLLDYAPGLDGLPKSDVLKFLLEDNCSLVVRPSGTEPKLKTYISVSAENKETAEKIEKAIAKDAETWFA